MFGKKCKAGLLVKGALGNPMHYYNPIHRCWKGPLKVTCQPLHTQRRVMLACWTAAPSHFLYWLCMVKFDFLNIVSLQNSFHCLPGVLCTSSERAVWVELCQTAEWSLSSTHPLLHGQMPGKQSDSEQISSLWILRGMGFISKGSDA